MSRIEKQTIDTQHCVLSERSRGHFAGTCLMVSTAVAVLFSSSVAHALPVGDDNVRPKYKLLRYEENWSNFDGSAGDDYWDPIKHVDLNDDGSYWVGFGGEMRFRGEAWENFGFSDAPSRDDSFALARLLIYSDFHFGDRLRFYFEGKSALSSDRDLPGGKRGLDEDTLDLQNGFAEYTFDIKDDMTLTARLGRQELSFGKQRLVSPLPWANTKRTWDAAKLILRFDRWRIDGFASRYAAVQKHQFNDWRPGPNFYGVYAAGKVGPKDKPYDLDLYWLGLDKRMGAFNGSAGEEDRHTIGARFGGKIAESNFDFDLEGAYQFGEVGSADISAFAFASQVGYTFTDPDWKPRLYVGFDYASGDDKAGDGDVGTFNQLFPLGHAYYGYMDFVGRQNSVDLSTGISFKPHKKIKVKADGHFFWRADTDDAMYHAGGGVVRAGALSNESEVGQELDITVAYKVDQHMSVVGGYSHFFAGDFLKESGTNADMDWFYFQVLYKF